MIRWRCATSQAQRRPDVVGGYARHTGDTRVRRRAALARPAGPAPELATVEQKHGVVRREGRWTLPHRLAVRTAWSGVLLDLTEAAHPGPELIVEMKVTGGTVELILAPGMTMDVNDLSAKYTAVAIDTPPAGNVPETLHVRVTGKAKHARISARWQEPR